MTYCIAPDDKSILEKLTCQLSLSVESKTVLKQSRIEGITVDPRTGQCNIELFVPALLSKADLAQITEFLRDATCLNSLRIQQRLCDAAQIFVKYKESIIQNIPGITPVTRRALTTADWHYADGVLDILLERSIGFDLMQREGVETSLPALLVQRFGLTVRLNVMVDEEAACYEELDCILQSLPQDVSVSCNSVGTDGEKTGEKVLLGSQIKGKPVDISSITEEQRGVVIQGMIGKSETKELKSGRCMLMFDVEDNTCAISCKAYCDNAADANIKLEQLKKGVAVRVKGTAMPDKYDGGELVVQVDHITKTAIEQLRDDSQVKRVELHAHTQMSNMDSVVPIAALISTAERYGHSAVAITDHGVIQAFPLAQELAQKSKVKVIYGMEGYLFDQDISQSNHIIILARNTQGLRNLYRLVSLSHIKYFHRTPRIPRSAILELREGLVLGSACEAGELFRAMLNGASMEELKNIAAFYDYLEIQPCANNQFLIRKGEAANLEALQDYNRQICEIGRLTGKPVAATCDVHFLREPGR